MNRNRLASTKLSLNWLLLIALSLTSCGGVPSLSAFVAPTPTTTPAPTTVPQAFPLALVETIPPQNSLLGHLSPITFYFNQPMNKPSAETALSGLPQGTFTWNDDATLVFTPTQPYPPNT